MQKRVELPLPANVVRYEHQVAGHGCSTPSKSVLYCQDEQCVYKPIQAPPKGNREAEFYEAVFANAPVGSDPGSERRRNLLNGLRPFLPAFHGVYRHPETGARYMRLEDLLSGFARPSVMDVKMGARSYEPTASAEKRESEIAKYAYRHEIGFFVTGLRVWRSGQLDGPNGFDEVDGGNRAEKAADGYYERFNKRYGKEITPDNMHERVIPPLIDSVPREHRHRLLRLIIAQLEAILTWFDAQDLFHFYASSILLGVECCPQALAQADRRHVLVKMVDFTHAVAVPAAQDSNEPANSCRGSPDEGYLLGLRTLISLCRGFEKKLSLSNGC
ncbi:hypothetical protein BOX15_Mlig010127g1 [Macrostomum lignano]|uniref:Kinase n=1 Tax=Macrostomum lignano TaxID=282301 RepID=A0A267EZ59_9PLAT|nr:hypothetical protein BOX15_Mlig010127g1 [Macrostomum lignano]